MSAFFEASGLAVLLLALSYLAGSTPTGLLVGRARGIDVRRIGSGNIGATNVSRALGKRLGLIVLVLDAVKGALPVVIARSFEVGMDWLPAACGLAAVLGHCFSLWLRFRGGKGVATSFGVFLALSPLASAVAAAIFLALFAAFRIASIGSLAAALSMPVVLLLVGASRETVILAAVLAAVIVVKHWGNLVRLMRGQENKL